MKKIICLVILSGAFIFSFAPALAADDQPNVLGEMGTHLQQAAEGGAGYGAPQDPRVTASLIINALLGVLGTVMLSLVIYAGFLWMTAGGNEDKITKAKGILWSSAIGLVIILSAYALVRLITLTALGGRQNVIPSRINETIDPFAPK